MEASSSRALLYGGVLTLLTLIMPVLAQAQTSPPTAEGVVGTIVDGNATCATVAPVAGLTNPVQLQASPPKSGQGTFDEIDNGDDFRVSISVSGSSVSFTDLSLVTSSGTSTVSQQRDTPGLEAVIIRSGSTAFLYHRVNWVTDTGLTSPSGSIGQITVCWSQGACLLNQSSVSSACSSYNTPTRTADILEAIEDVSPFPTNVCGCPPRVVRRCDPTLSQTPVFPANIVGVCNPSSQGGTLTGLQAESTVKTGTSSCVIKQIGGTYYQMCF